MFLRHLLLLAGLTVPNPLAAAGGDAVLWRNTPSYLQAPNACLYYGNVDRNRCPDPHGSLLIDGATPFPTLLTQTGEAGGLAWVEPDGSVRLNLASQRYMAQALAARALSDGKTLIVSSDLLSAGHPGYSRPHTALLDSAGNLLWNVPMGGFLRMKDRDSLSGKIEESPANGYLYAAVYGDQLRIQRLRRSDGLVEAQTRWDGIVSSPNSSSEKSNAANAGRPFAMWVGQSGLNVVTQNVWLRWSSDLQPLSAENWASRLAVNTSVRTFLGGANSDNVVLVTMGSDASCGLLKLGPTGAPIWQLSIPECAPQRTLERDGAGLLVFSGVLTVGGPSLFVVNELSGTLQRTIPLPYRAVRLAVAGNRAACLASVSESGSAGLITGVDIDSGNLAFQHDFPFLFQYPEPYFPDAMTPLLNTDGQSAFALHFGKYPYPAPGLFVAHSLAASSGTIVAETTPAPLLLPTTTGIFAPSSAGVLQGTRDPTADPPAWDLSFRNTLSGSVLWQRRIDSQWATLSTPLAYASPAATLLFSARFLSGGAAGHRVRLQKIDNATGLDIYVDEHDFAEAPVGPFLATQTPEGAVVYWGSYPTTGLRVLMFNPQGQLLADQTRTDLNRMFRTDQGRVLGTLFDLYRVDAATGALRTMGAAPAGNPLLPNWVDATDGSEDLWTVRSVANGSQTQVLIDRRRPDVGILFEQSLTVATARSVFLFAQTQLPDSDLVFELRTSMYEPSNHQRRLVRIDATTGNIVWDQVEPLSPGLSAGCRALLKGANGDLLCADTTSVPSSGNALTDWDPTMSFVRRIDPSTGIQRGTHWIAIETEAFRDAFLTDGPTSRSFDTTNNLAFAYVGPMPGGHAFDATEVGAIRPPQESPVIGDVSVSARALNGNVEFVVSSTATVPIADIAFGVDASDSGALGPFSCDAGVPTAADFRPYGARGSVSLPAGGSIRCTAIWASSSPVPLRNARVFVRPPYDFLDTDAGNNYAEAFGDRLQRDGFE
ncbi:MAG: hypothetical protein AB7E72_05695 [Lysobacterales bacterium]